MSLPLYTIRRSLGAKNAERQLPAGIKSAQLGGSTPKRTLPLSEMHNLRGIERPSLSSPESRKSTASRSPRQAPGLMTFMPSPKNLSPFDVSEDDNIMRLKVKQEQGKLWHFDKTNKSTPSRLAPSAPWNSQLLSFEEPPPLATHDLSNQFVSVTAPDAATPRKSNKLDVPKLPDAYMEQFETSARKPNKITSCWVSIVDAENVSINKSETQAPTFSRYGRLLTAPDINPLFAFEKTPATVCKEQQLVIPVLPPTARETSNTSRSSICGCITLTIPQS